MPQNLPSQGELHALREAAERAWGDDTRHPAYEGHPQPSLGQCHVTSSWLVSRYGGNVASKNGHFFWLSPDKKTVIDLTGDQFAYEPEDPSLEGVKLDEHDDGLRLDPHQKTYRPGPILVKDSSHSLYRGHRIHEPQGKPRVKHFIDRANYYFDNPSVHEALDYGGDAFPASQPQYEEDLENRYWHDEPDAELSNGEYQFVYGNGQLHISPFHDHEDLASHANVDLDAATPVAAGYASVSLGSASWQVSSNVAAHALERILKDYTKQVGWKWGGMTSVSGQPISDEQGHVAYICTFVNGHLKVGANLRVAWPDLGFGTSYGRIDVRGDRAKFTVTGDFHESDFNALQEWAEDYGLTLVAGNDNVIKTIEDLQTFNLADPNPAQPYDHQYFQPNGDQRQPGGVFRCPECSRLFPSWNTYQRHRDTEQTSQEPIEDGKFPSPNTDTTFPVHFTEQQPFTMPVASVKEARRVDGFDFYDKIWRFSKQGNRHYVAYLHGSPVGFATVTTDGNVVMIQSALKGKGIGTALMARLQQHFAELRSNGLSDEGIHLMKKMGWVNTKDQIWKWAVGKDPNALLEAPVPFIYDIQEDAIFVGHPGARHSDIPGRFTPGGIIEGLFEPGGKVNIRTMTNMPYSVRHMLELWYHEHPEYKIKSVFLKDDAGKSQKLANQDVGGYITALVASEPTVHTVAQALTKDGGHVFVVGGAVRDALLEREPKDFDLMVTGLSATRVRKALESLPGDGRVDLTGKDFGVFRYRSYDHDNEVEVSLPRRERTTGVNHKDFEIQADPNMKPEEDLYRRDFTPNAMAVDLSNGRLIDPFGGREDIQNNEFRTLNSKSLSEDPLRVVRALALHSRHGLDPSKDTRAQMRANAASLEHLPPERIQAELDKVMASNDPARAIVLAHETGVLSHILPEVDEAFGYDQNNPHHELELGRHLVNVLQRIQSQTSDPDLRLTALLHDIGKPASAWVDPVTGKNHFYAGPNGQGANHETVGARMVQDRLSQLRYPNDRIKRIGDLVQNHMWRPFTSQRGARKFLNKVGDHADDLMTLRWADQGGKSEYPSDPSLSLNQQQDLIRRVREANEPTSLKNLAVNGYDLMAVGINPGPQLGEILGRLTQAVVEDPALNSKDQLLTLAREYASIQEQS